MIDSIIVTPTVHMTVGATVLVTNFIFLIIVAWLVWQKKAFSTLAGLFFILFQVAMMLQVLIGIKLLDQGLGPLQFYIHYLGGLAPLALCLIFFWLPTTNTIAKTRRLLAVAVISFFFIFLTFAVGSIATS